MLALNLLKCAHLAISPHNATGDATWHNYWRSCITFGTTVAKETYVMNDSLTDFVVSYGLVPGNQVQPRNTFKA
jgi:hypothetical protein